ncbi:hypothetical protein GobsT_59220 [Gemmata obscuriglobus]|uniref:Uncharacterized protein n=1 Tax=Gemmata obscuriglobus TaxID=114 RepID=A0A2Z3H5Q1_9BACT|nr:hypothetical protein [Gemmata obscuriglobus]AWM36290.1 hypothetical protein C1280_04190 [Gemmata obscuriglobus]QEG31101.1 hypothetical protein GobsT_59220 [Gemmata obscuriglobus]VTS10438.1 Uncharacterized protein OS=Oscillatoria acuminata PCC 6304 GN=Oscil6304_4389 PE=4 SV=1 [Gemmata obscuriglobus UQM 2246]
MVRADLQEKLASVAADLLSFRSLQPAVRRIFAVPAGTWQSVAGCCTELVDLPKFAREIFAEHAERFVVTHLPWPGTGMSDSDCLVLFVHDDELWSTIAYFNRASLSVV